MHRFHRLLCAGILLGVAITILSHCRTPGPGDPDYDPAWPQRVPWTINFERDVKPMMEIRCLECHNHIDAKDNGFLNLETRKDAMTTGRHAPVIRPGDPENSYFIRVIETNHGDASGMPPSPDKIWGVRMKILKKWIRQGAVWPEEVRLTRPQDWAE